MRGPEGEAPGSIGSHKSLPSPRANLPEPFISTTSLVSVIYSLFITESEELTINIQALAFYAFGVSAVPLTCHTLEMLSFPFLNK